MVLLLSAVCVPFFVLGHISPVSRGQFHEICSSNDGKNRLNGGGCSLGGGRGMKSLSDPQK